MINCKGYGKMKSRAIGVPFFPAPGATQALYRALASSRTRLLDHIRRATVGRTPLNE